MTSADKFNDLLFVVWLVPVDKREPMKRQKMMLMNDVNEFSALRRNLMAGDIFKRSSKTIPHCFPENNLYYKFCNMRFRFSKQ